MPPAIKPACCYGNLRHKVLHLRVSRCSVQAWGDEDTCKLCGSGAYVASWGRRPFTQLNPELSSSASVERAVASGVTDTCPGRQNLPYPSWVGLVTAIWVPAACTYPSHHCMLGPNLLLYSAPLPCSKCEALYLSSSKHRGFRFQPSQCATGLVRRVLGNRTILDCCCKLSNPIPRAKTPRTSVKRQSR